MVVYEGAGLLRPPAQQPWGSSIPIPEPVVLRELCCFLQDSLGGKVKGSNPCARGADPVTQDLAGGILIIVHCVAKPPTGKITRGYVGRS